MIIKQLAEQRL